MILYDYPSAAGRGICTLHDGATQRGAPSNEAKMWINGRAIRAVTADQESLRLPNAFYERSKHPLDTHSGRYPSRPIATPGAT